MGWGVGPGSHTVALIAANNVMADSTIKASAAFAVKLLLMRALHLKRKLQGSWIVFAWVGSHTVMFRCPLSANSGPLSLELGRAVKQRRLE